MSDSEDVATARATGVSTRAIVTLLTIMVLLVVGLLSFVLTHGDTSSTAAGTASATPSLDATQQDAAFVTQVTTLLGAAPENPSTLIASAKASCQETTAQLASSVAAIKASKDTSKERLTVVGFSVYCPNRSPELDRLLSAG